MEDYHRLPQTHQTEPHPPTFFVVSHLFSTEIPWSKVLIPTVLAFSKNCQYFHLHFKKTLSKVSILEPYKIKILELFMFQLVLQLIHICFLHNSFHGIYLQLGHECFFFKRKFDFASKEKSVIWVQRRCVSIIIWKAN